jgi:hypothetical protein
VQTTTEPRLVSVDWVGVDDPPESQIELERASARRALALLKMRLHDEQILEALHSELEDSDRRIKEWTAGLDPAAALGAAVVRFEIAGMTSDAFLGWFREALADVHEGVYPASPEHYVMGWVYEPTPERPGRFRVVETIGGQPTYFHIDIVADPSRAESPVPLEPDHKSLQIGRGVLRDDETVLLFVHHQYTDTPEGFGIRTGIFFANGIPEEVVRGHREHLTVEWTNWIHMACAALR